METKELGTDALGTRYQRVDLLNGVEVMVLISDDEALIDDALPLDQLVGMAAKVALEELRRSPCTA